MPQPRDISASAAGFAGQLRAVGTLGLPVVLSRLGMFGIIFADTLMLGRHNSLELAHYGLANVIQQTLFIIGTGALSGTAVLIAQYRGAGEDHVVGTIWRVAMLTALGAGVLAVLLCLPGVAILRLLGQAPELAEGGGRVLRYHAIGMPGVYLFLVCGMMLEAMRRPTPVFATLIVGNLFNVALNALLIGPYGAEGAALATAIARWALAISLIVWIVVVLDRQRYNLFGPMTDAWRIGRVLRRLGYAMGLAQGLESAAFSSMMIFAGWLGAAAAAAWTITINVFSFIFMIAIGVSTATVVGVGQAVGAGDGEDAARAGWSGLFLVVLVMLGVAVLMFFLPAHVAAFYTSDAAVLALVVPCLFVAAFNLPGDGAQAVMMGALRGAGDVWVPVSLHIATFVVGMIPAGALFAFGFDFGLPGLVLGITVGVYSAALVLGWRFRWITKRGINRL